MDPEEDSIRVNFEWRVTMTYVTRHATQNRFQVLAYCHSKLLAADKLFESSQVLP